MMKMRAALLVVALLVVSWAVVAQGVRRDGKWEVKTETDEAGSPNGPPTTSIQCVTPKDIEDPYKATPIPTGEQGAVVCNFQHKVDGNKVTWSMQCDGGTTGTGEFIYTANAYTGTFKLSAAGEQAMTFKYSAKRLGDCDK
jgi:hypothetical protein